MIGKSLNERYSFSLLPPQRGMNFLSEVLSKHARPIVQVRAKDERMVACVIVGADAKAVRLCRQLGFDMKLGGTGVIGLLGPDAASLFPILPATHRAWLAVPCAPRETKVILVAASGLALFSLNVADGKLTATHAP